MSEFLVISSSLNPASNSRTMCRAAYELLSRRHSVQWIDLVELQLPMCDGAKSYEHPAVAPLSAKIRESKCVLLGTPVYNYDASASSKNLIELTGRAWLDKVVGFLCAAGGRTSYMAVMSFANSLMLDFRCLIIPRFVYADQERFEAGSIRDPEVTKRIEELVDSATKLTNSLGAS